MKIIALFAFNGDPVCFIHVLLNALDMNEKGYDIKLIIEGSAVKMVKELANLQAPLYTLYQKVKDKALIDCVCKACATKLGAAESAAEQGLPLGGDMNGHPSMADYREEGYEIITF
jgi:hypothetical protein